MATSEIPKVTETDLDRDDMTEAAEELGVDDHERLDDQELFEELGRRLGEIEDGSSQPDKSEDEQRTDVASRVSEQARGAAPPSGPDPQDMTRDQLREELRELGLPVTGTKPELLERVETARTAAAEATRDAAATGADTAKDAGQEARDTAADGSAAADREAGTEDEESFREDSEYRLEQDQRDGVVPLLDVEVGPLALDLLGLEVRLNRLHPVIVVNAEPKHALLGKLLSGVAGTADKLGLSTGAGKALDGVEKLVDTLPSPSGDDGSGESDESDEGDDEDRPGRLRRLGSRAMDAVRSAGSAASHTGAAAGNAGRAVKDAVTPGGKTKAAREATQAGDDLGDAASETKDAVTGT
jgi:hypothetical protein